MSSSSLYNTQSLHLKLYTALRTWCGKSPGIKTKFEFTSSLMVYEIFQWFIKTVTLWKIIKKLKKLYYLWISLAREMKFNDSCTSITHTSNLS